MSIVQVRKNLAIDAFNSNRDNLWDFDWSPEFAANALSDLVVFADDGVYIALSNGIAFDAPLKRSTEFGTLKSP